jgi:predicted transcriptional regulator
LTGPYENPANILLSVKPVYAEKMLSGEKTVEFRRVLPKDNFSKIAIYSSSPVNMIVAVADMVQVISGMPKELWENASEKGGISEEEFYRYYSGCLTASAFCLRRVTPLSPPVALGELGPGFARPPQSFRYLTDDQMSLIESRKIEKFKFREYALSVPAVMAVQVTPENHEDIGERCRLKTRWNDWVIRSAKEEEHFTVPDRFFRDIFRPKE